MVIEWLYQARPLPGFLPGGLEPGREGKNATIMYRDNREQKQAARFILALLIGTVAATFAALALAGWLG